MNNLQELIDNEKEYANKLIKSIRLFADIRNVKVKNPSSNSMEMISLHEWYAWLYKRLEKGVGYGIEEDFIHIIDKINIRNQMILEELELSIVNILSVVDKLEAMIKDKETIIDGQNQKLEKSFFLSSIQPEMNPLIENKEPVIVIDTEQNNIKTDEKTEEENKKPITKKKKIGGLGSI